MFLHNVLTCPVLCADKPPYPVQQTSGPPPTYSQSTQQQQPAVVVFDQGAAVKEGQAVNVPVSVSQLTP